MKKKGEKLEWSGHKKRNWQRKLVTRSAAATTTERREAKCQSLSSKKRSLSLYVRKMGEEEEAIVQSTSAPASSSSQEQSLLITKDQRQKKAVRLAVDTQPPQPSVSFVEPELQPLNGHDQDEVGEPSGPEEPKSIAQGLFSAVSVVKKVSQRVSTKKQGRQSLWTFLQLALCCTVLSSPPFKLFDH